MKTMNVAHYDTHYVLSLAYAAYRVNGDYIKETKRPLDPENVVWSNKELVAYTISKQNAEKWLPESFESIVVTDSDREAATNAINYVKRYTLKLLSDKITGFQKDVFDCLSSEKIPAIKLSLICYVPKLIEKEKSEDVLRKTIRNEYQNSVHYPVDSKVTGTLKLFKKIFLKHYDIFLYTGAIENNLVSFTTKHELDVSLPYNVTAKSVKHQNCLDTGYPQTKISYVKIKKNGKTSKVKKEAV